MSVDTLFTKEQISRLFENNKIAIALEVFEPNFPPVAFLYAEKLNYKFLVTQIEERCPATAFALSDYGDGGLIFEVLDIDRLEKEVENKGDVLRSDPSFAGKYNLAIYAKVADKMEQIITEAESEEIKLLFETFNQQPRYHNSNQNIRRFKFGVIC